MFIQNVFSVLIKSNVINEDLTSLHNTYKEAFMEWISIDLTPKGPQQIGHSNTHVICCGFVSWITLLWLKSKNTIIFFFLVCLKCFHFFYRALNKISHTKKNTKYLHRKDKAIKWNKKKYTDLARLELTVSNFLSWFIEISKNKRLQIA